MNPLHQQINELEQLAAELHDYPGYSWAIDRIRRVVEDLEIIGQTINRPRKFTP